MVKKSWNRSKRLRAKTKRLRRDLKLLKRQRAKKARRVAKNIDKCPNLIYKTTGAWDII